MPNKAILQRKKELIQEEEQQRKEDALDNQLFEALEIMRKPTKLGINKDNKFVELYPVPVFKGHYVTGVKYRTTKAVELPDELFERLCILEDEIEALSPKSEAEKAPKGDTIGRPVKYAPEEVAEWVQLREQGLTYGEIAEATGATKSSVSNYLRKYNRQRAE